MRYLFFTQRRFFRKRWLFWIGCFSTAYCSVLSWVGRGVYPTLQIADRTIETLKSRLLQSQCMDKNVNEHISDWTIFVKKLETSNIVVIFCSSVHFAQTENKHLPKIVAKCHQTKSEWLNWRKKDSTCMPIRNRIPKF